MSLTLLWHKQVPKIDQAKAALVLSSNAIACISMALPWFTFCDCSMSDVLLIVPRMAQCKDNRKLRSLLTGFSKIRVGLINYFIPN